MKTILHCAIATAITGTLLSAGAHAAPVTWEDIARDDTTPGDVLSYGFGLKA